MKRFIFDLDGTLLTGDFTPEHDFFHSIYGKDSYKLSDNVVKYLDDYERKHQKYNTEELSYHLSEACGLSVTPEIIDGWNEIVGFIPSVIEEGVVDLLEYLKSKDYSLAVLTNWFGVAQRKRLERAGLLEYFDNIYAGDMVLKPHKDSYLCAKDQFNIDECVLIGDNLLKDYIAPRSVGMHSIIYDKKDIQHDTVTKIKKMNEIKEKY